MEIIKVQKIKTTAKIKSIVWKERKLLKDESVETVIQNLKSKKECFKVCSKTVEKTYIFNGNNYEIASVLTGK
ncbi:hypothetical protein [Tenacibaculum halocynthiae]|uniref:hypothetical protein n=1 Tax=Tenacibaculum halocynthiae TaxID=1254437 RepID=UPI003D65CD5A